MASASAFSLLSAVVERQFDVFPTIIEYLHPRDVAALACASRCYRDLIRDSAHIWRWMFARFRTSTALREAMAPVHRLAMLGGGQDASDDVLQVLRRVVTMLRNDTDTDNGVDASSRRRTVWSPLVTHPLLALTFRELAWPRNDRYRRAVLYLFDRVCARTERWPRNDPRCDFQFVRDTEALGAGRFEAIARSPELYFSNAPFRAADVSWRELARFRYTRSMIRAVVSPTPPAPRFSALRRFAIDVLRLDRRVNGTTCFDGDLWLRIERMPVPAPVDALGLVVRVLVPDRCSASSIVAKRWIVAAVVTPDRAWLTSLATPAVLDAIDADPARFFARSGRDNACWACGGAMRKRSRTGRWLGKKCADRVWRYKLDRRKRQRLEPDAE